MERIRHVSRLATRAARVLTMPRDQFSKPVKEAMAKRVGYRCTAPWCRAMTVGPSNSRVSGTTMVGTAAHVTGATDTAARWDPSLTSLQRRSLENGVWLCQNHGKLVDDDETRYPVQLLLQWRKRAEELAHMELSGDSHDWDELFVHERPLDPTAADHLHSEIDTFIRDVGALEIWEAPAADAARLAIYEIALNEVEHGHTTKLTIKSEPNAITIRSHAPRFGRSELLGCTAGRGGKAAVEALLTEMAGTLDLVYRYEDASEWSVVFVHGSDESWPCGVSLDDLLSRDFAEIEAGLAGCAEVHIYTPRLFAYSDASKLFARVPELFEGRAVVVHGVGAGRMRDWVVSFVPDAVFR